MEGDRPNQPKNQLEISQASGDRGGAEKTKEGAKKTGEAIKDVFTDSDKDSDKDGK